MTEWFKVTVLKTVVPKRYREFESHPHRDIRYAIVHMTTKQIWLKSFLHATGVAAYITGLAGFFHLTETFSNRSIPEFFAPIIMLLLFVISAAVTSFLVFGKPVMLFLEGKKKEAALFLASTISSMLFIWLLIIIVLLFR